MSEEDYSMAWDKIHVHRQYAIRKETEYGRGISVFEIISQSECKFSYYLEGTETYDYVLRKCGWSPDDLNKGTSYACLVTASRFGIRAL